jgi:hypothetical protein
VKLGVSGATPDLRASPRGAHLAAATAAATGLAAVHALESRRRLTRPKRKPTTERPGGGRRVGRLMAPSIAIDIHPEGTAARVDVVNTFRYPQVVSRCFASFRVVKFRLSAGHRAFCAEFDSRRPHQESAGQNHRFWPVFFLINICGRDSLDDVASVTAYWVADAGCVMRTPNGRSVVAADIAGVALDW